MGNLAGSCFHLLCGGMLCAVRTVGLLCAVAQFFHKLLHHLPLYGGCDLMFRLLVLWTVVSLSNVWNKNHLRFVSHRETHFYAIDVAYYHVCAIIK